MIRGSSLCGQLAARVAMVVWFAVIAGAAQGASRTVRMTRPSIPCH